jgi:hypothetical protein
MATMHLGRDAAGYHHGPEGVGGCTCSNHSGSGSHDRVVVLVAEPLTARSGRSRLGSASLAPHDADLPNASEWCRQHCLGNNSTIAPSRSRCQPVGASYAVEVGSNTPPAHLDVPRQELGDDAHAHAASRGSHDLHRRMAVRWHARASRRGGQSYEEAEAWCIGIGCSASR